jgi:D-threonate/D-erythronate kinase
MSILIIADDLSGAADCAIGFASAGHRTVVTLDPSSVGAVDADVIAADTDSRRLSPADAAGRVSAAYEKLQAPGRRLYKKIDSTLRGNWAAEVAALQPLAGLAIVAPAFPATGRTLRGGRVFVHGEPLESTDTWKLDNFDRPADVQAMLAGAGLSTALLDVEALRRDPGDLARRIRTSGAQALIIDAQTDQDLLTLARVTSQMDEALFWVGSGGLARELATLADLFHTDVPPGEITHRHEAPILVLVGSLSAVSERQCAMLRERGGVGELIVPPALLRDGASHPDWTAWQERIGATLAARTDLLLRIGRDEAFDPAEGAHLSNALAALVEPHFTKAGGLIATGGETARAMLSAAGIGSLQLLQEIEAGVAVGRPLDAGRVHRPGIVTKAGAFGTDHALYAAWLHLSDAVEPAAASPITR